MTLCFDAPITASRIAYARRLCMLSASSSQHPCTFSDMIISEARECHHDHHVAAMSAVSPEYTEYVHREPSPGRSNAPSTRSGRGYNEELTCLTVSCVLDGEAYGRTEMCVRSPRPAGGANGTWRRPAPAPGGVAPLKESRIRSGASVSMNDRRRWRPNALTQRRYAAYLRNGRIDDDAYAAKEFDARRRLNEFAVAG